MKLQAAQFAEIFEHIRDHGKPVSQQDAADLVKVREFEAPSKAHLKRLARHASGVRFVDVAKNREISQNAKLLQTQRENFKKLIAELGGSMTIAPTAAGIEENAKRQGLIVRHVHPMSGPAVQAQVTPEEKAFRERKRLYSAHKSAMQDMMYTEYQPSLLDYAEYGC